MRVRILALLAAVCASLLLFAPRGFTAEKDDPGFVETTEASTAAVDRGLAFLARRQNPITGAFGDDYEVAITSLAGLAFLAQGNVPGRGRYGENVRRALQYILRQCDEDKAGFIQEPKKHSRMHGHGYATLFLAEVYGMSESIPGQDLKFLREKLHKAIRVIMRAQTEEGGWGYTTEREYDEASVTVCEVQALRAARNAGLQVPKDVIDHAVQYVQRCANKDESGSFVYSLRGHANRSSFALTAAAISTLVYTGQYDAPEIQPGLQYLIKNRPGATRNDSSHYFYENYYAALAMYYAGGDYWRNWFPSIRDELVQRQNRSKTAADGCWPGEYCEEYCTAFALLILQIPYRYLPIFQK
ncbi:MAG: terpene cyclase/mutase family protein [Planctomycetes bacterium]|nr:terpene cyclase/mutase family protein [Planctomycetota bacterium]